VTILSDTNDGAARIRHVIQRDHLTGSEMFHWRSFRGLKDSRRDQEGIARDSSWASPGSRQR
jgi:hypothetical protein